MVLPATALAIPITAELFRSLRVQLIATLAREHITVARAKGVPTRRLLLRHALECARCGSYLARTLHRCIDNLPTILKLVDI